MIERIDKKNVRIKHNGVFYYLEVHEDANLGIIETVFIRGFKEGKELTDSDTNKKEDKNEHRRRRSRNAI